MGLTNKRLIRRKGFTLVELSIVLVIIGLLIGGILVAQSMISTARTQKVISSLQQYMTAARNFQTNYKYLPGDYPTNTFGCTGDGDGVVEFPGPSCVANGHTLYEATAFFVQLSKIGFIPDRLDYLSTDDFLFIPGLNVPTGPAKNSAFIVKQTYSLSGWPNVVDFGWGPSTSLNYGQNQTFLFYVKYAANSSGGTPIYPANVISAQDAYSIDLKIDDAMPNTGDIMATIGQAAVGDTITGPCGAAPHSGHPSQWDVTSAYNVSNKDPNCVVGMRFVP